MRILALALVLMLLQVFLRAQSATELDRAAVARAKNVIASALDDRLPKISLEFFLQYEAAGKPVWWRVVECGEESDAGKDPAPDQTCVEAEFDRKHNGTVKVIVSVATSKKSQAAPAFVFATVTDTAGSPRRIHRLGDLPMELQRRPPRTPKDLPSTVATLVFPAIFESAG